MLQANTRSRSSVPHAEDCNAKFIDYADNAKAEVDVWQVTVGSSIFILYMMRMKKPDASWVFGSIKDIKGKIVWSFRSDVRVQAGFRGDVYTKAFLGNPTTWVFFENSQDRSVVHVVPLVQLLVSRDDTRTGTLLSPQSDDDHRQWFIHNVLSRMVQS